MLIDVGILVRREDETIGLAKTVKPPEQPTTVRYRRPREAISAGDAELTEIRFRHIRIVLRPNLEDIEIAKKLLKTLENLIKIESESRGKETRRRGNIPPLTNFLPEGERP